MYTGPVLAASTTWEHYPIPITSSSASSSELSKRVATEIVMLPSVSPRSPRLSPDLFHCRDSAVRHYVGLDAIEHPILDRVQNMARTSNEVIKQFVLVQVWHPCRRCR